MNGNWLILKSILLISFLFRTFVVMNKDLKMKRIMFSYLETLYPEIYLLKLDFLGDIVQTFDESKQKGWFDDRGVNSSPDSWYMMRKKIISRLELMFSVDYTTADSVLNDWVNCRPKYEYVRNSMDEQVLVRVTEECHMTL
jgi:hypothetical protein